MIDMYRQHIETPMSIPDDLQKSMDFNAGNKYGRIYRIVPKNAGMYKKVSPDLRNAKIYGPGCIAFASKPMVEAYGPEAASGTTG